MARKKRRRQAAGGRRRVSFAHAEIPQEEPSALMREILEEQRWAGIAPRKKRRRTGNPSRGPRRYYYDHDARPGSWVGMSAVYPTWAKADDQLNSMLKSASTLKQYVDVGTMKVIKVGGPGRGTGYMVVAKAKRRRTGNPSRGPRRRNPLVSHVYRGTEYRVAPQADGLWLVQFRRANSWVSWQAFPTKKWATQAAKELIAGRRTSNFASGMRYIHNLPPRARTTRWMANPRKAMKLPKAQRSLLNWMNRNGGISDGKITTQTAAVRRALGALHRRGLVRKSGRTGKNARYTLTTKGFHALGKVKGVRVKRVSRRKKR